MPTLIETNGYTSSFCRECDLRTSFALSMSAMYKAENPLYGDLIHVVREVNLTGVNYPETFTHSAPGPNNITRLDLERRGAVRAGAS